MGIVGSVGGELAKRVAPTVTGQTVREILERAIDGAGPIPGAAKSADAQLRKAAGDVERAIDALISQHVKLAGGQGFLTNLGGLVTMAVSMPVNLAGVALLQCHLAAGIVHLRGYDLNRPAVRDAILVCLLDQDARKALAKDTGLRVSPAELIVSDEQPRLRQKIARAVTGQLIAGVGGKRVASFVARRIPVLGGAIGGVGDAWSTRRIGLDTAQLPPNAAGEVLMQPSRTAEGTRGG